MAHCAHPEEARWPLTVMDQTAYAKQYIPGAEILVAAFEPELA